MTAKNTEQALVVLSNSYHKLDKNVAVIVKGMKSMPTRDWTEAKINTIVSDKIESTKDKCELSRKNAVKKMTIREMILVSGMFITALGVIVPAIVKALQ